MHSAQLQRASAAQAQVRPISAVTLPRRCQRVPLHVCAAASTSAAAQQQQPPPPNPAIMGVMEALFKFPPLFKMAAGKARSMIVQRAEAIGVDWEGTMQRRRQHNWEAELDSVVNEKVSYPEYYTQPFHAYEKGNLSWDSALEVTMAALSVHAGVMDPANKDYKPDGDHQLRSRYSARMQELMAQDGINPSSIKSIVDLGCATGLSSRALLEAFPGAAVTGVDLSPYFLAVGKYEQREREAATGAPEPISWVHAPAEATGLPSASVDLVSMCLVAHELPQDATRAILREAYRLLKPGGVMSIMEMDPSTPAFQRIFSNPFAFAAFKSTEPHLAEYVSLDLARAYTEAGFPTPCQLNNTPRHRTLVARKPLAA